MKLFICEIQSHKEKVPKVAFDFYLNSFLSQIIHFSFVDNFFLLQINVTFILGENNQMIRKEGP